MLEAPLAVQVSPPRVNMDAPLQLLCTNLDYDEHKGRIAIGRITSGRVNKAETVVVCKPGAPVFGSAEGGSELDTPLGRHGVQRAVVLGIEL